MDVDFFKYKILTVLAKYRLSSCTGYYLSYLVRSGSPKSNAEGCGVSILCLPKLGFNQDVESIFEGNNNYCLFRLKRKLLKTVFYQFLPKSVDDNNYIGNTAYHEAKRELRVFWTKVIAVLFRKLHIKIVFTGNFSYASEQEFAGACEQLGVRFVALHKECLKTPGLEPFYTDVYKTKKNKFQGSFSLVYNEIEKRIQQTSGVVPPDNIIVTGMARMDRLHLLRKKREAPIKPQILFFSFNPKAGLPIIGRKIPERFEKLSAELEGLHLKNLSRSCHQLMLEIAQANPDITVVVKTKGDGQALITLSDIFGEDPVFPPNFEILAGGDLIDALNVSCVATGFNSTALLEAIALGVNVIVPHFYEADNERIKPYIVDLENGAKKCYAIDDYKEKLVHHARNAVGQAVAKELDSEQRHLLDHWLGNPDGKAGKRVLETIGQLLSQ